MTTNTRTAELLADKLAAAVELATIAERDASSELADWTEVLDELYALAQTIESATETAVRAARQDGLTWDQIGRYLRVSRQAVHQRYGGPGA